MVAETRLSVRGGPVSVSSHGKGETAVVLGHGAGGDRRAPFLVALAEAVAASGRLAVLYNFPYSEAGRGRPDATDVLEETTRVVADHVRTELGSERLVHGGKSMGGRIASQVVAGGGPADGLVFLGYPLHPPGKPDALRDRHLPLITAPMLFVQGTRDAFARWDLLTAVLERLGERAALHRVEDGDHSFAVRKKTGRSKDDVIAEVHSAVLGWLDARGL
jgi:predicted alpha/beta-hydrolase family hydrolase